jgi:hypothetical protein
VSALLDSQLLETVRDPDDLLLQVAERDLAAIVVRLAFPEVGDLIPLAALQEILPASLVQNSSKPCS